MNLPPLLLAAAVIFWGWQSGQWWLAGTIALLLEAPRFNRLRFHFSITELNRIADLCTLALMIVAGYFAYRSGVADAVPEVVKWTPLIVLPLFLAIAYGGFSRIDLSVVMMSLRRNAEKRTDPSYLVNLGIPYVVLWLLAASESNTGGPGFYIGLTAFCAWLLSRMKPVSSAPLVWAAALLIAAASGTALHNGLHRLQGAIEEAASDWFNGDAEEDPARVRTDMGHIGQLKLSDSVALRVTSSAPLRLPLLLHTASYNTFSWTAWNVAGDAHFRDLPREKDGTSVWRLGQTAPSAAPVLEISATANHQGTLLALPDAAARVEGTDIGALGRNRLGSVKAETPPGRYAYRASYDPQYAERTPPEEADRKIPREDADMLRALVRQLDLENKSPDAILESVSAYFANNFTYSTYRSGNASGHTALRDFLIRNRSGHCEHFATATVMLLRAAGLPARYAVGFSLQEQSRFGGYIARQRHAHAWARVYVNGRWQNIDTTPASWTSVENRSASFWEPLSDTWSWLMVRLHRLSWSDFAIVGWAGGISATLWLGYKLIRRRKRGDTRRQAPVPKHPGAEIDVDRMTEFHRIEQLLAERGLARPESEPLTAWLARIAARIGDQPAARLKAIVQLHYRCRFGPHAGAEQQEQLRAACQAWIEDFNLDTTDPLRTG